MNTLLGFLGDCYRKSGAERRGEIGFLDGLEIGREEEWNERERERERTWRRTAPSVRALHWIAICVF